MGKVRVVTDSSCDLPKEVLEEFGIVVVPLVVRIGKEEFLETDLEIGAYWRKVEAIRAEGLFPQTSQPSIGAFESVFAELVDEGNEVVCVTITSKHSGTFNNAAVAARNISQKISVFDSWTISLGLGFQALAATELAREGATVSSILDLLGRIRAKTHLLAVLDTIEYIRMGGRANALMPVLARVTRFLQIKPIIGFVEGELNEGELKLIGQGRPFSVALAKVEQQMIKLRPFENLGVIHTRRPQEAQAFAKQLRESLEFSGEILVRETGAVLSSHAGPRVIGAVGVEAL